MKQTFTITSISDTFPRTDRSQANIGCSHAATLIKRHRQTRLASHGRDGFHKALEHHVDNYVLLLVLHEYDYIKIIFEHEDDLRQNECRGGSEWQRGRSWRPLGSQPRARRGAAARPRGLVSRSWRWSCSRLRPGAGAGTAGAGSWLQNTLSRAEMGTRIIYRISRNQIMNPMKSLLT